uniref:Dynein heavy chain, cytoplasmic n=1 Tax=Trypanosoma vivax (strain Y486) TaxID=1055687 RepID=G0TYC2_TRYVY|nr:putative dynein heavy chain, cytosolic, fragment [Trypanosoma vivax Y486]
MAQVENKYITAAELLSHEVVDFITSVMSLATEHDVREALGRAHVAYNAAQSTERSLSGEQTCARREHCGGQALRLIVCEISPDHLDRVKGRRGLERVVVVQDLSTVLRVTAVSNGTSQGRHPAQRCDPATFSHGVLKCVLITAASNGGPPAPSKANTQGIVVPFKLSQLNVHVIDTRQPLASLQALIHGIYEPLLYHKGDVALSCQLQELVGSIRMRYNPFSDVDLMQFVHRDLRNVCAAHPEAEPSQLVKYLAVAQSTDAAFLREVSAVRSSCCAILDVSFNAQASESTTLWGCTTSIREEVAHWKRVLHWVERIQEQMKSREWRLLHLLLASHVETDYEADFEKHAELARICEGHTEKLFHAVSQLSTVKDTRSFAANSASVISISVQCPRYPSLRTSHLLGCVVHEITSRFTELATKLGVLNKSSPEKKIQTLNDMGDVLQELKSHSSQVQQAFSNNRATRGDYTGTQGVVHEVGSAVNASGAEHDANFSPLLERVLKLKSFINGHFMYEHALNVADTGALIDGCSAAPFRAALVGAYNTFCAEVVKDGSLWDVSPSGSANFERLMTMYKESLSCVDDGMVQFAWKALTGTQDREGGVDSIAAPVEKRASYRPPLHRIYAWLLPIPRPRVQAVLGNFRLVLREQAEREMREVRERYFDSQGAYNATQALVARLGISWNAGRILWEFSMQSEMEEYILRQDILSEHGWQRLLLLRTVDHRWALNKQLACVIGVPLEALITNELTADSELHGTAYALAFLNLVHGKDKSRWSRDKYLQEAQKFVLDGGADSLLHAKSRLVLLHVGQNLEGEQDEVWDAHSLCDTIVKNIEKSVTHWCEVATSRVAFVDVASGTFSMSGPVLQIIDVQDPNVHSNNCNAGNLRGSGRIGAWSSTKAKRALVPNLPQDIPTLYRDLELLDTMELLDSHTKAADRLRLFFQENRQRFRSACCIKRAIDAFEVVVGNEGGLLSHLATEKYTDVHHTLLEGARLRWSDEGKLERFTQCIAERVNSFCSVVAYTRRAVARIECLIQQLSDSSVAVTVQSILAYVTEISELVVRISGRSESACWWVDNLQSRIDAAVTLRLQAQLHRWAEEYASMTSDSSYLNQTAKTEEFALRPLRVQLNVTPKWSGLALSPVACRNHWINELNKSFAWLHRVPRLVQAHQLHTEGKMTHLPPSSPSPSKLDDTLNENQTTGALVYEAPLRCLAPHALAEPLAAIEKCIQDAVRVESEWQRGQRLLSIEYGALHQRLGNDLEKWDMVLSCFRKLSETLMDYTEPCKLLGGVVIIAEEAQKELGRKLSVITQYIYAQYKDVVEEHLESVCKLLMKERASVEGYNVANDLNDAAQFLCRLHEIRAQLRDIGKRVASLVTAEEYLKRYGALQQSKWMRMSRLKAEYRSYKELVGQKTKLLESRKPFLKKQARRHEEELHQQALKLGEALDYFNGRIGAADKESASHLEALAGRMQESFHEMQLEVAHMLDKRTRVVALCKVLGLEPVPDETVETIAPRIEDLKWISDHILSAYQQLSALSRIPFSDADPDLLHENLSQLKHKVEALPTNARYREVQKELIEVIERRLASRSILCELCSGVMSPVMEAERHWTALKSLLGAEWELGKLTVGDVWHSDPISHSKVYLDVLEFARGEGQLRAQMESIVSFWTGFEFKTTAYKGHSILIQEWDAVFSRMFDDLDTLQGFRLSPFFRSPQITDAAAGWERRLNSLLKSMKMLMEIQQRWVHLDGVFSDCGGIRQQLPDDAVQFDRASREFLALLTPKGSSRGLVVGTGRGAGDVVCGMTTALAELTASATAILTTNKGVTAEWMASFPLQVLCLAFQVWWVQLQEQTFLKWQAEDEQCDKRHRSAAVGQMVLLLNQMAMDATMDRTRALRRAMEELITLAVNQRDVSSRIETKHITSAGEFEWLRILRLYKTSCNGRVQAMTQDEAQLGQSASNEMRTCELYCRIADASFAHSFEYIGWYQRLVQTTLTDRCYLTLTQALHTQYGGGMQLGRHVLVFNCADTFDLSALGRILIGLCQVGAWGCFDEFNRLEEQVLSAVSQQIQAVQEALRMRSGTATIEQQTISLQGNVALFITMNPDFAARSNLPVNLKQLFRSVVVTAPGRETIVEVMLFAQGFQTAGELSRKIVALFDLCAEQLSRQSHYDFGLRALKSVLIDAAKLRQAAYKPVDASENRAFHPNEAATGSCSGPHKEEHKFIICSLINGIVPRLVSEDVELFYSLLRDFFPDGPLSDMSTVCLRAAVEEACRVTRYSTVPAWVDKICQLYHTRKTRHSLMLVGPSGSGKSSCWKTLLRAMARMQCHGGPSTIDSERKGPLEQHAYVINPKSMSKEELFGAFEVTTREWKDGVFTGMLRHIIENVKSKRAQQEHWIVFDGDVDPDWVENLNSLLDDSRVYTLPNGERLSLPSSVCVLFEVQNLRYATPATVSRCGIVWFSEGTIPVSCLMGRYISGYFQLPMVDRHGKKQTVEAFEESEDPYVRSWGSYFVTACPSVKCSCLPLETKDKESTPTREKNEGGEHACQSSAVNTWNGAGMAFKTSESSGDSAMNSPVRSVGSSNSYPSLDRDTLALQAMMASTWLSAFSCDGLLDRAFKVIHSEPYWTRGVMEHSDVQFMRNVHSLLVDGVWRMWHCCQESGVMPSSDIVSDYAEKTLIYAVFWGFGVSLNNVLRAQLLKDLGLHQTVVSDILALMDTEPDPRHGGWCSIRERMEITDIGPEKMDVDSVVVPTVETTLNMKLLQSWIGSGRAGIILCGPPGSGKTMLLNHILRRASSEHETVHLNFSSGTRPDHVIRVLERHCRVRTYTVHGPVMSPSSGKCLLLFCDELHHPVADQYDTQHVVQFLRQLIEYGGYYRSRDKVWVTVEGVQVVGACNPPTDVGRVPLSQCFLRWAHVLLVDFQTTDQGYFGSKRQPQYTYTPRDLTRWTRAVHEVLLSWGRSERRQLTVEGLVRLAVHEGMRILHDRLAQPSERDWLVMTIDRCFLTHFTGISATVLERPLLFSAQLDGVYREVSRETLRMHVETQLEVFCEEEIGTKLVAFDAMIDHLARVCRVLMQPCSHMLLIGAAGVGKTVTTRLAAWMSGTSVFSIDAHGNYQLCDFERDLREVMRRAGCGMERICFLFDCRNTVRSNFIEYTNALLASGEIPGLFEGDAWGKLMVDIRGSVEAQQLIGASRSGHQEQHWVQGSGVQTPRCLSVGGDPDKTGVESVVGRHERVCSPVDELPRYRSGSHKFQWSQLPPHEAHHVMASAKYVDTASEQELYRWFVGNVRRNLHFVLTVDPSSTEFTAWAATSPALFSRCTIDWFERWDQATRHHVAKRLTEGMDVLFSSGETIGRCAPMACQALPQGLSEIHEITEAVSRELHHRNAYGGILVTSRNFIDMTHHLRALYEDRRDRAAEQHNYLRCGLDKLDATSKDVEQQQAKLQEYKSVLKERELRAQTMLDRIVSETETTKLEKSVAEKFFQQLEDEENLILADKAQVERELSEVEPFLREAEEALGAIKPEHLREIRAYTTPPTMVKRVLELVLVTMGERQASDWDVIKLYVRREDFLPSVRMLRPQDITEAACQQVRAILQQEGFTYEAAMHASKAAGPLLQWVEAQVNYATIYTSLLPLRTRIREIESQHDTKRVHLQQTEAKVCAMEESLRVLKSDYQAITEEMATVKRNIVSVAARCGRATRLLQQLLEEQQRWKSDVAGISEEVSVLLGDCVLAAASLTYFGCFDEHTRQSLLLPRWCTCLQNLRIPARELPSGGLAGFLATPSRRLAWERDGLPKDKLSMENALILEHCRRFPLVIDPAGMVASFLIRRHAHDTVKATSFTKADCLKQVAMAARLGYTLVVEDAELMGCSLVPLLSGELHRTGGRALVLVGGQEVEVARSFRLFLTTRDPRYELPSILAGAMSVVSFTVTQSSLETQCRQKLMLHEHTEMDGQRTRELQAQEEDLLRIRSMEQELLLLIAQCDNSLLENDAAIEALERLKMGVEDLKRNIAESQRSMHAFNVVEERYRPLSEALAEFYFSLQQFSQLHRLYHYNVELIFRALGDSLAMLPPRKSSTSDGESAESDRENELRLATITREVFNLLHHRVRRGMFSQDHLALAVTLGKLRSGIPDAVGRQIAPEEWDLFEVTVEAQEKQKAEDAAVNGCAEFPEILRDERVCCCPSKAALAELLHLPLFAEVHASLRNADQKSAWEAYLTSGAPHKEEAPAFATASHVGDENVNVGVGGAIGRTRRAFITALLLLHTRPDAFLPAFWKFVHLFFCNGNMTTDDGGRDVVENTATDYSRGSFFDYAPVDLAAVLGELTSCTPLVLVASAGSDPTGPLEHIARALGVQLYVVAMGSTKSAGAADCYLDTAMADGSWVVLKNMHLACSYAGVVERCLHRKRVEGELHSGFRLIFTIEVAHTSGNYTSVTSALKSSSAPLTRFPEVMRIYLAAAWLHAVVMERLLHTPLGWSTRYEFSDLEFWHAVQIIDNWVPLRAAWNDSAHTSGELIERSHISWAALRTLIGVTLYGGKVNNEFDQYLIHAFCEQFLNPAIFDDGQLFCLMGITASCSRFECCAIETLEDVQKWIRTLPDITEPEWARLPANASRVALVRGTDIAMKQLSVVRLPGEERRRLHDWEVCKQGGDPCASIETHSLHDRHWTEKIARFCGFWIAQLEKLQGEAGPPEGEAWKLEGKGKAPHGLHPTTVVIQREYHFALNLLHEVLNTLRGLARACAVGLETSAEHQQVIKDILRNQVPPTWAKLYSPHPKMVVQWMADVRRRVAHVQHLHKSLSQTTCHSLSIHLGLLFCPSAFLSATKQEAARAMKMPLEQMKMQLELYEEENVRMRALHSARGGGEKTSEKEVDLVMKAERINNEAALVWHIVGLTLCSATLSSGAADSKTSSENCGAVCERVSGSLASASVLVGGLIRWVPHHPLAPSSGHGALAGEPRFVGECSLLGKLLSHEEGSRLLLTPLYESDLHDAVLQVVELEVNLKGMPAHTWYEFGACLAAWSTDHPLQHSLKATASLR